MNFAHNSQLDLVVPVYNEPENVATMYAEVVRLVKADWKMYIVYDFDADPTLPVLKSIAASDGRVHIVKSTSRGVAHALKTGFDRASAEAIMTLMADDPSSVIGEIDTILARFHSENAAIVAPSRYMRGGEHWGSWSFKKILSYSAGASLGMLVGLPIHDATYATRMFRRSLLQSITIESSRGFEIALEITVKAHLKGEKIVEIPVVWSERVRGVSKFKLFAWLHAYAHWYLYAILRYYLPAQFRNT
ncbi:MAG: glycosyltransferase [Minisyncoccia bacterium]